MCTLLNACALVPMVQTFNIIHVNILLREIAHVMHVLLFLLNICLPYNVTFLQAISDLFKVVIRYRKMRILQLLINLFLHVRNHFLLFRGCSVILQLTTFLYISYLHRCCRYLQIFVPRCATNTAL